MSLFPSWPDLPVELKTNAMAKRKPMIDPQTQTILRKDFTTADEPVLIKAARSSPEAFEQLYRAHVQPVFRYLYSRIGSLAEAEDATAQTFLAAMEALPRYREEGHFASWLFAIARKKAMDHFRSRRKRADIESVEHIPDPMDLLQEVIRSEQHAELAKLIHSLPEKEFELIRLRYVAELNFSEIARLLHRSEGAVKKRLYRLLARLQSQLEVEHE
jgi:RNA polymerase sigma-70 factor (ECF subfamily)